MPSAPASRFAVFGQAIASARHTAGLKRQADLATVLGVQQQTVSRWEAGTHRPSEKQLPAIAAALRLNVSDIRSMLGDDRAVGQSFTRPLPLGALAPDDFEQFVADLIQAEHPGAQVRRAGKTGHKQDGLDVRAILPNNEVIDVQCKRVETFGEAKVRAAVSAYIGNAERKALALSRVASPAADLAARAAGWQMWDQDDLSRRLRALSPEKQIRLVDTYFRGQRRELIGRDEPGPWRTTDEYFRPYIGKPVFNHDIPLLGRKDELAEISEAVCSHDSNITIISAPGGMGKSKILESVVEDIQGIEAATTIRFLSDSSEATRRDLEDLGPGSKILIVDDAHNRPGLAPIFEFAADPAQQTRVLVATRPYALDKIKRDAALFGTSSTNVIKLAPLSKEKLTALTSRALRNAGAPEEWASMIVRASDRSPLVATMAARIASAQGISPELAKNIDDFRNVVMARFTDILSSQAIGHGSRENASTLLDVIALIQPFDPQSRQFLELTKSIDLSDDEVSSNIKQLIEGGVLLSRGSEWRIMPDVVGDYIIQRSCIDAAGNLTPFVTRLVEALSRSNLLRNVLSNLGRMDWRLNGGDTNSSTLLSSIWRSFDSIENEHDARIEAIKAIAIYQPKYAIDFVVNAIYRGHRFSSFAEILKSVFLSGYQSDEALEVLWELGRVDRRETGPHPNHPIRILNDIAEYNPDKPISLTVRIVDFAIKLGDLKRNWSERYTPLDLLKPALSTEGHTNRWTPRALQMTPFTVTYDAVAEIRRVVIDHVLRLLAHDDALIATLAAKFLRQLVQEPHGLFGMRPDAKIKERLHPEFVDTLNRVKEIISRDARPEVFVEVVRAVDWHAKYGEEPIKSVCECIQKSMPTELRFRLTLSLLHGHGFLLMHKGNISSWHDEAANFINEVVKEFREAHASSQDRFMALQQAMSDLVGAGQSLMSANAAIVAILKEDLDLCRLIVESALAQNESPINNFARFALWEIFEADREGARRFARSFLESSDKSLHYAAAVAFHGIGQIRNDEDADLLEALLTHDDPNVVIPALRLIALSGELSEAERISLLLGISLNGNTQIADELCVFFVGPTRDAISIDKEIAARILSKIEDLPKLEGHWIDALLARFSQEFSDITLDFFIRRVEFAAAAQSFEMRPVNHGPYGGEKLKFASSQDAIDTFRRAWMWMKSCSLKDIYYREMAGNLFEAMLGRDEPVIVDLFQPLLATASREDIDAITSFVRHVHHRFVLRNSEFTIELLERSAEFGPDVLTAVTDTLASSALSGGWSGAPGEPMPRDLEDEQQSAEVLENLSRISPAYKLYDIINKSAKRSIDASIKEGLLMDDAEENEF